MTRLQENSRYCNICTCVHNFKGNHQNKTNTVHAQIKNKKAQTPFYIVTFLDAIQL